MADIFVNILGDASKLKGELDKSSKNVSSFSEKIGKIGKIATVAGAAVTGAFTAIVLKTAAVGDQFDKMSLRTGVSVEDLSSLAYTASICGTDVTTLENSLRFLAKGIKETSDGTGIAKDAFEELGISVIDIEGNLRPTVDVMKEAATKLAAMDDETRKVALAGEIFGSRYGSQLLPMLKIGGEGIEELMGKAEKLGITMSTEAATKAAEFTDRITDLKGSLAGAGRMIGDTLIPAIIPMIEKVTEIVGKVVAWTKENPELVATITKVAAVVGVAAAVGGPILMLVSAFSAIAPAIALIGTVATGPIGLLIIAVTAIIAVWKNWDKIVEFVSGFVDKIIKFLTDLKNMAIQKVTEMIDWIIKKFEDLANLPKKMLDWGKNAITGFADGIKGATSKVTDSIKGAANKVKSFFGFESPPGEGPLSGSDKWMPNMMAMFGEGITDNIPKVIIPVETLSTNIMSIFENLKNDFKSNIVDPIMGYLENQLANAIVGLLDNTSDFEWSWSNFWAGLKKTLIDAVAAMIAKLIVLAAFKWLFPWLGFETGGGVGYQFGGEVKKYQFGGMADTIPARLTVGEYVIAKPMTDFIKRFRAIPQNLVDAVIRGFPTPVPAFAGGGAVGPANISRSDFGETKIYVDIHDNKISDDVDIKRLAATVSNEILRKINLNRRH